MKNWKPGRDSLLFQYFGESSFQISHMDKHLSEGKPKLNEGHVHSQHSLPRGILPLQPFDHFCFVPPPPLFF